jgi:uroporphyrinogen-III synthase
MPSLSLDGFTVGVTADRRAEEQCEMLKRRGARVVHGPAIRTMPLAADAGIRRATEQLIAESPAVVIANTGIGIRSWFAAAESWGLGDALHHALAPAQVLARGPKAAGAVLTAGIDVAWRAPSESLAAVVDRVLQQSAPGIRVAFQLDGSQEQPQVDRLRATGADVVEVPVYTWALPEDERPMRRLIEATCNHRLDAVTFTSAGAVHNLFAIAEQADRADALRSAFANPVLPMCVGPICADAVASLGVDGLQPPRARLGSMVHTLNDALSRRRRRYRAGTTDMVVQGSLVVVAGAKGVHLTDRERQVFDLLSSRPRAVVTHVELLRAVWGPGADQHALEVTVTRLRRRLGRAGSAVATVVRRGYRFDADPVPASNELSSS